MDPHNPELPRDLRRSPWVCKRKGCERCARVDDFCSTLCAKLHFGAIPLDPDASKKRRARKHRAKRIENAILAANELGIDLFENEDAMTKRLPGGYGTGKRR